MRIKNWITSIVAIGLTLVIVANLARPTAWAASAVAPVGQTVPTKTPTKTPTAVSQTQEPATPVRTAASTPASPPALLPQAGGGPDAGLVIVGIAGPGLLALAWTVRRRAKSLP